MRFSLCSEFDKLVDDDGYPPAVLASDNCKRPLHFFFFCQKRKHYIYILLNFVIIFYKHKLICPQFLYVILF